MSAREVATTVVSTKGQVILPKSIRDRRKWAPGTRLAVEETPQGVLLKPVSLFPRTRSEDVAGSLAYQGPAKTIDEMNASIDAEVQRRHACGRY